MRETSEAEGERRPLKPFLLEACCSDDEGLEVPSTRRVTRGICFGVGGRCDGRGEAIVCRVLDKQARWLRVGLVARSRLKLALVIN